MDTCDRQSLSACNPGRHDIPILAGLALLLLLVGQLAPALTLEKLVGGATFSVITGMVDLYRSGNIFLAILVFSFSIVFPIVKLVYLFIIWFRPMSADDRHAQLDRLKFLGKWSMLDVFVIVVFVGSIRLGILAEAEAHYGIYVFGLAILLSLVATFNAEGLAARAQEDQPLRRQPTHVLVCSLLMLGCFLAGVLLPMMEIERWLFWKSDYSLVRGTWGLFRQGEHWLGAGVALFVVLLPLATFLLVVYLLVRQRVGQVSQRGTNLLRLLDKWSMVDVFGLALLVVIAKTSDMAEVQPRLGLWLFLVAALLNVYVSWQLHRSA